MAIPAYVVPTKFTAKEWVSDAFKKMDDAASKFDKTATKAGKNSSSAMRNATKEGYKFATVVKGILFADFLRGGLNVVKNAVQGSATNFLDFDDAMVGAFARFDDLGPRAKNVKDELLDLKQGTLDAIRGTEHSAVSAGKAMDFFAKANWSSKSATVALRPMLDLSTAAGEEFAETVSMTNDLLGAFDMRAENSGKQLEYLSRMTDVLTRSGLDANGGLVDFFETMKGVGPIARSVGAELEDVGAMQVLLANAGIKGTNAETALKRALINIPSARLKEKFAAPGVDIKIADAKGNIRPYIDIFTDINKFMSTMGNRNKINIAEDIFGMYGVAGGINILSGLEKVIKERDRLLGAKGITQEIAEFRRQHSMNIRLAILKNAALEKSFEFFESFKYGGMKGFDALVLAIRKFDLKPTIENLKTIGKFITAIWPAVNLLLQNLPGLMKLFIEWKVTLGLIKLGKFFADLSGGAGAVARMTTAFKLMAVPVSTLALALISVIASWEALHSLWTGKDNFISEIAQEIGLVPKLIKDENGVTTGRVSVGQQNGIGKEMSGTAYGWNQMMDGKISFIEWMTTGADKFARMQQGIVDKKPATPSWAAPNAKEAAARNSSIFGQLNITGDTKGATLTTSTKGAPPLAISLLGAQ